jgi:xylan 1,4-beta-xylosidase
MNADQKEYFKLYKITAEAVKAVNADLKVGGPAICGGADYWIKDFLNFCSENNVPVDFVSRHAYTAAMPERTPHLVYQGLFPIDYMLNELKTVRKMIDESPFPHLPFYITEWNSSYNPLNPVHDTALNAAYLARAISECGDYVDIFSYWTFSDVFEECDVPRAQFHGGFGLIALNGIVKPTGHMFSFFAKLGEEQLYRDENIIVTRCPDGSIALVAWNPILEKRSEEDCVRNIEINIPVSYNNVFVTTHLVDEGHGNAWTAWNQMGRPRYPDKSQIGILKKASVPEFGCYRASAQNGILKIQLTLGRNGVCLAEASELVDETGTYLGLDDSRIMGY